MSEEYVKVSQKLNKTERYLLSILLVHGEIMLASLRQERQYKSFARAAQTLYQKGLLDKFSQKGYKNGVPFKKITLKSNIFSYCVQISTESRCDNAKSNST